MLARLMFVLVLVHRVAVAVTAGRMGGIGYVFRFLIVYLLQCETMAGHFLSIITFQCEIM